MITALSRSLIAGPVVLAAHLPAEVRAHGALAGQVLANQRTAGEGPTPGILGFIMTFVIALLVVGLVLAMTTSLRRVKHRAGQMGEAGGPADAAGARPDLPDGPDVADSPEGPPAQGRAR